MRSYRKTEISDLSEETLQEGDQLAVHITRDYGTGATHHGVVSRDPEGNLAVLDMVKTRTTSTFPSVGSLFSASTSPSSSSTGSGEGMNRRVMSPQEWSEEYSVRHCGVAVRRCAWLNHKACSSLQSPPPFPRHVVAPSSGHRDGNIVSGLPCSLTP